MTAPRRADADSAGAAERINSPMSIELKVPDVGESITQVQIGRWLKQTGDTVSRDEPLVEIETDKITAELPAPSDGRLGKVLKQTGDEAEVGQTIAYLETDGAAADEQQQEAATAQTEAGKEEAESATAAEARPAPEPSTTEAHPESEEEDGDKATVVEAPDQTAEARTEAEAEPQAEGEAEAEAEPSEAAEKAQEPARAEEAEKARPAAEQPAPKGRSLPKGIPADDPDIEVVPMSPMRRRIAERLVQAQQTAAMLTTFNEVDMSQVIALRKQYQEAFQQRYEIKLGFMSFFIKASIEALKEFPAVNAQVHEQSIVYFHRYDIGVAIGGGKGLVVPVIRHAERLSMAQIEKAIADYARRAQDNTLELKDLQGGTFTISNGGVYGSLLSTPILNPPQSGILGLHAIQERPVAREGQVVIRPMMNVALSYDHRIVDGREAVTFLRRIKEIIESPMRLLIEV